MRHEMYLVLVAFVVGLSFCGVSGAAVYGCPPQELIAPCECIIPSYYLVCNDIQDIDDLRRIAANLEGVPTLFAKLWITNSTLQYLPSELLEIVKVKELNFDNVMMQSLFDTPPSSLPWFETIRLRSVKLMSGVVWRLFSQMENLKTISIDGLPVTALKNDFRVNVPHNLKELELLRAKTRKFEIGTFDDFFKMKKLVVYECKLEEIQRENFPVPFNVERMHLAMNKLRVIPADLFTNMPYLKDIILVGNQISTLPESALDGRYSQLDRLLMSDNPLKCDCNLRWIVTRRPQFFDGTCAAPKILHGKELRSLEWSHFVC